MSNTHPTSAIGDTEIKPVYFESVDLGTGVREDDEIGYAVATIHRWTCEGSGIILSPADIALAKVSQRETWTPSQLADAEFEVRRALLPALLYDRGIDGRRIPGTLLMPLNANTGTHETDDDYLAFVNLEGTIAGNKIGRFGACRIQPGTIDKRGQIHNIRLNDRGYVDGRTFHPLMIEGFVKGYASLEDASADADELRSALTKVRNANRAPIEPEEREYQDKPARNAGF